MSQAVLGRIVRPALCILALTVLGYAEANAQADARQIAVGDSIFNGNHLGACWACHGSKGKGTSNGPKLSDKEWLTIDGSVEAIKGVVKNGVPKPKKHKTPMPPMGGAKLTDEQIDGVAAYVASLSK